MRIIYRENNWKNRKFKEAARVTLHNKEQLMNKKDERNAISGAKPGFKSTPSKHHEQF